VLDWPRGKRTYSERTRAAVVLVFEQWTSLAATSTFLYLLVKELDLGWHSHTLPKIWGLALSFDCALFAGTPLNIVMNAINSVWCDWVHSAHSSKYLYHNNSSIKENIVNSISISICANQFIGSIHASNVQCGYMMCICNSNMKNVCASAIFRTFCPNICSISCTET
jgi:hypothetical protein